MRLRLNVSTRCYYDQYINTVLWLDNNYFILFVGPIKSLVCGTRHFCLVFSFTFHAWKKVKRIFWIFVQRILCQVSRPNKLSHNCLFQDSLIYLCASYFLACLMPRLTLEQVKAQQREAIRFRTERRVAELKVEQGKRDWEEILSLCALLWVCLIVGFYAKLYFL